jgi:predicted metal-dependent peptidase
MSDNLARLIKYARTFLLLSNPFFGTLVINIPIKEQNGPGDTAWTDGKCIKFNPSYANRVSKEEFVAVLLHQILHTALQHKRRGQGLENKLAWNEACDNIVNFIIAANSEKMHDKMRLPDFMKPQDRFKNMSAEQVYAILVKEIKDDRGGGNGMEWDLFLENGDNLNDLLYAEMNSLLVRAENAAKMQGLTPFGIDREYDTLLHPKVDWRIMLKEFVQSFPNDWDFTNRDRRFMNSNFYLPSLNGEKVRIAIAIDTSGSITHKEVSHFMTEAYSILSSYSRVELIMMCCDAAVHNVKKITTLQEATSFEIKGGGGTDFKPVFKELENYHADFDALIFFTDGYGTFPDNNQHYGYKVLWVMTTEVKAPMGITIRY